MEFLSRELRLPRNKGAESGPLFKAFWFLVLIKLTKEPTEWPKRCPSEIRLSRKWRIVAGLIFTFFCRC